MPSRDPNLPDFVEPPVIETVFGVAFVPISGWRIPHYGLFWNDLRSDYPRIDVQPPVTLQPERFGAEEKLQNQLSLELVPEPWVRCWFLNARGSALVQIQSDAFLHNWRKMGSTDSYPHYDSTRRIFERDWSRYAAFLKANQMSAPVVTQCEITYVNHIERGTLWTEFADIPSIFPSWSGYRSGRFLPDPDGAGFNVRFQMPRQQGRLNISLQPGVRQSDGKDVLEFKLTARGRPASSDLKDILEWLDLGREWIVRGFTDMTSEKAHKFWKRRQ